ncbi:hypothetical protein DXG01_009847 [Tephrocybe rancida]|nr:hypothetical protein DXG01_009847 [Tephrocybe rancida]
MSREVYLRTVLAELRTHDLGQERERVGLIVSMDRRMGEEALGEVVGLARKLRNEGEPVVGVDLCGDPLAGDVEVFGKYILEAREAGLGVTVHIAETEKNTPEETMKSLSLVPDRLGHATFLNEEVKRAVTANNACIEICLTSNLLLVSLSFSHPSAMRIDVDVRGREITAGRDPLPEPQKAISSTSGITATLTVTRHAHKALAAMVLPKSLGSGTPLTPWKFGPDPSSTTFKGSGISVTAIVFGPDPPSATSKVDPSSDPDPVERIVTRERNNDGSTILQSVMHNGPQLAEASPSLNTPRLRHKQRRNHPQTEARPAQDNDAHFLSPVPIHKPVISANEAASTGATPASRAENSQGIDEQLVQLSEDQPTISGAAFQQFY